MSPLFGVVVCCVLFVVTRDPFVVVVAAAKKPDGFAGAFVPVSSSNRIDHAPRNGEGGGEGQVGRSGGKQQDGQRWQPEW